MVCGDDIMSNDKDMSNNEQDVEYTGPGVGVGVIISYVVDDAPHAVFTLRNSGATNRVGEWDLPGGKVEKGSCIRATIITEVEEELGLKVEPEGCFGIYEDYVPGQHWISFAYVARRTQFSKALPENREPHKFDEIGVFPIENSPRPLSKLTEEVLHDYIKFKKSGYLYVPIHTVDDFK